MMARSAQDSTGVDIKADIASLRVPHTVVREDVIQRLNDHWQEAEPLLLAEMDRIIAAPLAAEQTNSLYYAIILCAYHRTAAAFDRYEALLRLQPNIADFILGDMVNDPMPRCLAVTCSGRVERLKALVLDAPAVLEWARGSALSALAILHVDEDALSHADLCAFLDEILRQRTLDDCDLVLNFAASLCGNLKHRDALPLLEVAFDYGRVDPEYMELREIIDCWEKDDEVIAAALDRELGPPITSPAACLEPWLTNDTWLDDLHAITDETLREYHEYQRNKARLATRKIGRNDPCFCGSGRKYKKCCLATGALPSTDIDLLPGDIPLTWILLGIDAGERGVYHENVACFQRAMLEYPRELILSCSDATNPESTEVVRDWLTYNFMTAMVETRTFPYFATLYRRWLAQTLAGISDLSVEERLLLDDIDLILSAYGGHATAVIDRLESRCGQPGETHRTVRRFLALASAEDAGNLGRAPDYERAIMHLEAITAELDPESRKRNEQIIATMRATAALALAKEAKLALMPCL